ncbi:16S rRNA pseudouridine(516) synthase [Neisseria sp. Ec49-e6-T10]|uniref:16S rRNA pseudouridine(516) synthase n=1 Tax=Neisseria sp. Ec49-e6-T10 TaxID=3140744 RepID=UPI003EBA75D2
MQLFRYLQSQGLGSKKQCLAYIAQQAVCVNQKVLCDPKAEVISEEVEHLSLFDELVLHVPLPYFYFVLHKPAYYETSHNPSVYPSVFSLFPDNIRALKPQAVGRLDADTTGLLLITNDGQFNHDMTSPKGHVSKVYEVTLKHPADDLFCDKLRQGVLLKDETQLTVAKQAFLIHERLLSLEIQEGKYHQVKRMVAAASNRVEKLHRTQFGSYSLNGLPEGKWLQVSKRE